MCLNKIKINRINSDAKEIEELFVPCGKCIECLMQKSTDIAVRGILEYRKWNKDFQGSFITLTYNEKYLPKNRSLKKQDYIVFLRELRRYIKKEQNRTGIRILGCGEYGTLKGRPHYHLVIFNWIPNDLKIDNSCTSKSKYTLYKSKILSKLWGKGRVVIGKASENTVGYVAGYTTKKGFKLNKYNKKGIYEKEIETIKKRELIIDKEKSIIYHKKKSTDEKRLRSVKKRSEINYIKEYEFIAMPKGKLGGLGSLDELETMNLIKNVTISLYNGTEVKNYNVPYYYIKKAKERLRERENCRDFILNNNTNKIFNNNYIDLGLTDKELLEIQIENRKRILKIKEALDNWEGNNAEFFWNKLEEAKKNNMRIDEWKKYQAKIRLRKTYNRLKNLKRDFEPDKDWKNNERPWFLDNEIGSLLISEMKDCDCIKEFETTYFDKMLV